MQRMMKMFNCVQLGTDSSRTNKQYIDISKLIYETDPYIYPALFGKEQNAIKLLPDVIEDNQDKMFAKQNMYILLSDKKNNEREVVGLILWHSGKLGWDGERLLAAAEKVGVTLPTENVKRVREQYVDKRYKNDNQAIGDQPENGQTPKGDQPKESQSKDNQTIYLLNVCIKKKYRGHGWGKYLLGEFIKEHVDKPMELAVLADNKLAIRLYEQCGFKIDQEVPGFSLTDDKPECWIMKRQPLKTEQ